MSNATDLVWISANAPRAGVLESGKWFKTLEGTPQGPGIRPILAKLFWHYALDEWMRRNYPNIPFERYVDDIIVNCKSGRQAKWIKSIIEKWLSECRLELHPAKTKIVYCNDDERRGNYANEKFDFLVYTFRPRKVKSRYKK